MSTNEVRPQEGLGAQAAAGVAWLAAQKWVVRAFGFATLLVLARELSPRDFGVVAAAMTVIPMVHLLADLGFSTYLLQADEPDQRTLSTALWVSVAAGGVLSAGLVGAAPLLAMAFSIPELTDVLRVLALAVVATVLAAVPLALLRRAMAFRTVALQGMAAALLAQVLAVAVALGGGGVWALVVQVVVGQWVIAVLAWWRAGWRPSLTLSPEEFRRMASFGLRVSAVDLVATSRLWAEAWVITVTLGPATLGLLSIAQRLVQTAQELTSASLVPVSTVLFARVRETAERVRGSYAKALGVAYAVVAPFMAAIVVTAPVLVPMLFGPQWRESVAPTQALAVAGIITLGAMVDHGLFYGLAKPGSWLGYAAVVDAATVATTVFAVRWGLVGVAVGFVVVAVLATAARWVLVGRLIGAPAATVARPFVVVLAPTAACVAAGLLTMAALDNARPSVVVVLIGGLVTAVVYLAVLRVLAAGILRDTLGILPVPDRMTRPVRRILRLDPVTA
ncbi:MULTISPECIES: oligosaccharide flippase family protein [unclassified Knoellia]|uniref:oligosaccharide flippase family protein n=1 Tax=Knoellia altitudinis TaxID=3404795 RepID=UPI00361DA67F